MVVGCFQDPGFLGPTGAVDSGVRGRARAGVRGEREAEARASSEPWTIEAQRVPRIGYWIRAHARMAVFCFSVPCVNRSGAGRPVTLRKAAGRHVQRGRPARAPGAKRATARAERHTPRRAGRPARPLAGAPAGRPGGRGPAKRDRVGHGRDESARAHFLHQWGEPLCPRSASNYSFCVGDRGLEPRSATSQDAGEAVASRMPHVFGSPSASSTPEVRERPSGLSERPDGCAHQEELA